MNDSNKISNELEVEIKDVLSEIEKSDKKVHFISITLTCVIYIIFFIICLKYNYLIDFIFYMLFFLFVYKKMEKLIKKFLNYKNYLKIIKEMNENKIINKLISSVFEQCKFDCNLIKNHKVEIAYGLIKNNETKDRIVYSGVLAKVKLNKDTKQKLRIKSNFLDSEKNIVDLDYSSFEYFFNVFSTNKIFSLMILTPDYMEYLIDIQKKLNKQYLTYIFKKVDINYKNKIKINDNIITLKIEIINENLNILIYHENIFEIDYYNLKNSLCNMYFYLDIIKELIIKFLNKLYDNSIC